MDYKELVSKIDIVVQNIDMITANLSKKIKLYSDRIKDLEQIKNENIQKYHYELEKCNYYILKNQNKITKSELFKKRCNYYKAYLKYKTEGDILNIKRNEYNFVKTVQSEAIFYYNSLEKELNIRTTIERICNVELNSLDTIQNLRKEKNKKYQYFVNREFSFDEDRIFTLDYLNYDVEEVVDLLYKPKRNVKKAS